MLLEAVAREAFRASRHPSLTDVARVNDVSGRDGEIQQNRPVPPTLFDVRKRGQGAS